MKKLFLSFAVMTALLSIATSCRKNDKLLNEADKFDNLIANRKSKVQTFSVPISTGGTITGIGTSKITFPPNAFKNQTTGVANIELRESLKKSQWLMDGLSTNTQTGILISGGMINLDITNNATGQVLEPATAMQVPASPTGLGSVIRVEMPRNTNAANVDMNLFLPDSTQAGTATNPVTAWEKANNFPFNSNSTSYVFQIPKFKWINADQFWNIPGPKTTIKVTPDLKDLEGSSNVKVLLVYRNINSVITLTPKGGFYESYANLIPVGGVADVVFIGKSANGGILFKALPAVTLTTLLNINIKPEIVTGAVVDTYLNSID